MGCDMNTDSTIEIQNEDSHLLALVRPNTPAISTVIQNATATKQKARK